MPSSWKVLVQRALFCFCLAALNAVHLLPLGKRRRIAERLARFSGDSMDGREARRLAKAVMLHRAMGRLDALLPAAVSVEVTESARAIPPGSAMLVLPTLFPRALRHWRLETERCSPPPLAIIRVERPGIFRCAIRSFPAGENEKMGTEEFRSHLRSLIAENPAWFPWETEEISELFSGASREES